MSFDRIKFLIGPSFVALILLGEIIFLLAGVSGQTSGVEAVPAEEVAKSLFSVYVIGIELVSFLLLSGLIGAFHLAGGVRQVCYGDGRCRWLPFH